MYARSIQQSKCITSEASLEIGLFKILMFREQLGKYRLNSYHFSSLLLLVFFSFFSLLVMLSSLLLRSWEFLTVASSSFFR